MSVAEKPKATPGVGKPKTLLEMLVDEMKEKVAQGGLRQSWVSYPQSPELN